MFTEMADETATDIEVGNFVASKGWYEKFAKRHNLSLRRKTSVAQKDPDQLIAKLVAYVLRVRRLRVEHEFELFNIIAMDETPVWSDMVSNTTIDVTGVKTVTLKTTGHEKCRVSVCFSAKADGTKLKPMIVFKGAKREVDILAKEFRGKCVIASSPNAWMNTDLTHQYINSVLGAFCFKRRLLAWDTYQCHLVPSVTESLHAKKISVALVPGGCTKYIQGPDVSWNKPFKAHCTEKYDEWLEADGITRETECGNLKPPPRREIVRWVLESWGQLSASLIAKSFISCGLSVATDGSQDDNITCFKPDRPCSSGRELLNAQLNFLAGQEPNPFVPEVEDVQEACPSALLLDEACDEDEYIDISD